MGLSKFRHDASCIFIARIEFVRLRHEHDVENGAGYAPILTEPLMGHAAPPHLQKAFFDAILQHIEENK